MKKTLIITSVLLWTSIILFAQQRADWVQVTDSAGWQARDSQGELVYKNKMWILGGWFSSYGTPPTDVWSSKDGKKWELENNAAPWIHSDLPMSITFKNKMWMMGGWYNGRLPGHEPTNNVWSSKDGKDWKLESKAGWTPRIASAIVEFKGRMWILGGTENYYFGDNDSHKNDVWSSKDGKNWELMTSNAGWSPRAYHQAAVLNGKIYVFGGGNYLPEYYEAKDVWSSEDGIHWTKVCDTVPWRGRIWFSSVVYRGHMWVLGGWTKETSKDLGDVWYSKDGKEWKQLESDVIWKPRHELSALIFQDKLWVLGGKPGRLDDDVWSLHLPKDWKGQ